MVGIIKLKKRRREKRKEKKTQTKQIEEKSQTEYFNIYFKEMFNANVVLALNISVVRNSFTTL